MKKNVYGRKFKRDKGERNALFKSLLSSLVINGRVKTTHEKAKAVKADADKMITKARKEGVLAKRLLEQDLFPHAIEKLMKEVAPRFAKRNGGYTRIIKLGNRFSDNASTAILEWVEGEEVVLPVKEKKAPKAAKAPIKKVSKAKATKKIVVKKAPAKAKGGKNARAKK